MNDVADEVLDHMDSAFAGVDDALVELEAERVVIDDKIARLKAFKKLMGGDSKPRRGRPLSKVKDTRGTVKRANIDPERLEMIVRTILAMEVEQFTMNNIHAILAPSWSPAATAQVFRYLRAIEFIGKMGLERGTQRQLWKVTNRSAVEGLV